MKAITIVLAACVAVAACSKAPNLNPPSRAASGQKVERLLPNGDIPTTAPDSTGSRYN